MNRLPLIVIVGPTASGKTALAIDLAERFGGEIICADSRTVYKGMDIGTAKPTLEERRGVPHWGLDLVKPNQKYSAARFQAYANEKVNQIRSRGQVPFLVGGTGLYIDAVLFDYDFPKMSATKDSEKFEKMTVQELLEYCTKNNIKPPKNHKNKRYVINAIVRQGQEPKRKRVPLEDAIIVGITTKTEDLLHRIELRANRIFSDGVLEEAVALSDKYGWESEAMTGNVYPIVRQYLKGELTMDQAIGKSAIKDRQLAKRQLTWLRRNEHIQWMPLSEAHTYLTQKLASQNKS